jgi:hypothetical protein
VVVDSGSPLEQGGHGGVDVLVAPFVEVVLLEEGEHIGDGQPVLEHGPEHRLLSLGALRRHERQFFGLGELAGVGRTPRNPGRSGSRSLAASGEQRAQFIGELIARQGSVPILFVKRQQSEERACGMTRHG